MHCMVHGAWCRCMVRGDVRMWRTILQVNVVMFSKCWQLLLSVLLTQHAARPFPDSLIFISTCFDLFTVLYCFLISLQSGRRYLLSSFMQEIRVFYNSVEIMSDWSIPLCYPTMAKPAIKQSIRSQKHHMI
jgi:hypothetical protein